MKVAIKWIKKGYKIATVLDFVGLSESTYYYNINHNSEDDNSSNNPNGRPIPGYSYSYAGEKVSDEQIKEWLLELVAGDGFPYGYKKLTTCLKEDYMLKINHKKVYRLCKELDILRPQRKIKNRHPRRLAKRDEISNSNQLWEMDLKYGYITGTDQFFFQLSVIDVFDRSIIDYHLGLSCKAEDACRVLKKALAKRELTKGMDLPVIRTDNGPQFTSKLFGSTCQSLGMKHQKIPVKTPNMNAHIESFHSILEDECYSRNEFQSYIEVYEIVSEYMRYYNNRRRHGSLNNQAPTQYYRAVKDKKIKPEVFIA
ncbi:transposase [Halobacteroides halobius DSM 5150]|uniref:Transposase n=1 Tax=Halobacteroides halobius (strain ATCC 35273 / DSM 5150 / MD-1) TaxID=748449 RepID=L0K868_HALHC|nr:transposase [Halobacteroides halobius DSM 5150]